MNEEFLVDPVGFNSALELKYILEKFGFFSGTIHWSISKKLEKTDLREYR